MVKLRQNYGSIIEAANNELMRWTRKSLPVSWKKLVHKRDEGGSLTRLNCNKFGGQVPPGQSLPRAPQYVYTPLHCLPSQITKWRSEISSCSSCSLNDKLTDKIFLDHVPARYRDVGNVLFSSSYSIGINMADRSPIASLTFKL